LAVGIVEELPGKELKSDGYRLEELVGGFSYACSNSNVLHVKGSDTNRKW
jgi:hypothetical protein